MNTGTELWLFAVSLGASALGGTLGMASGIFVVPVLTMFGHVDIRSAIGASIVSVIACSCSSAAPFLKGRLTDVRLAIVLETATTAGALRGYTREAAIRPNKHRGTRDDRIDSLLTWVTTAIGQKGKPALISRSRRAKTFAMQVP